MGSRLVIILLCGIFCVTLLLAEEPQDQQDSVVTEDPLSSLAVTTDANTQGDEVSTKGSTGAKLSDSAHKKPTELTNSTLFNYESANETTIDNATFPPDLLNVSNSQPQELEEFTTDIIVETTTVATKGKSTGSKNENGTDQFTWNVFEVGNGDSDAPEKDDKTDTKVTTEAPDDQLQFLSGIINASGPFNWSLEGKPISLSQTMRDILQLMRNSNSDIRHQLAKRYKLKRQPPKGKKCRDEHLIPCNFGSGRDCNLLLLPVTGCFVCTCPYKSPARGCLGPAEMSPRAVDQFMNGTKKCDSGAKPQIVDRYMRVIDLKGIDDCVPTKQPYCDFLEDVNTYRMPRTKKECYYHCFTDKEIHARNIDMNDIESQ